MGQSLADKEFLKKGRLMPNADLWKELTDLCDLHQVDFIWVKGHAGIEENERCDVLSMAALAEEDLPEDEGFIEEEGAPRARPSPPSTTVRRNRKRRKSPRPDSPVASAAGPWKNANRKSKAKAPITTSGISIVQAATRCTWSMRPNDVLSRPRKRAGTAPNIFV